MESKQLIDIPYDIRRWRCYQKERDLSRERNGKRWGCLFHTSPLSSHMMFWSWPLIPVFCFLKVPFNLLTLILSPLQPFQRVNQNLWERKAHRAGHGHGIENPDRCILKCFRKTRLSQTMGENQPPFYFTGYSFICKCAK